MARDEDPLFVEVELERKPPRQGCRLHARQRAHTLDRSIKELPALFVGVTDHVRRY
jgi:hypothetical protein